MSFNINARGEGTSGNLSFVKKKMKTTSDHINLKRIESHEIKPQSHKKKNKRSMQRQIRRLMIFNSSIATLILSIIVIIVVISSVSSLGMVASDVIASDIVGELENPMSLDKFGSKNLDDIDMNDGMFLRWLNAIGNKFYFNLGSGFAMNSEEDLMKLPPDAKPLKDKTGQDIFQLQLVYVKIAFEGNVLYSTYPDESKKDASEVMTFINNSHQAEKEFRKMSGETAGVVTVLFNPFIVIAISGALISVFILGLILTTIISIVMSKLMAISLTMPLGELHRKMDKLAEGDIESALSSEVEIKKPFFEIDRLADSTNRIINKMRGYVETLEDQKVELTAQNDELEEKSAHLIQINGQLEVINIQMKDILDNVGQGFLRFEQNLVIHSGYSSECLEIFKGKIDNEKLSHIIFPEDEDQASFVDELLTKILTEDPSKIHLYLPLLPDEATVNNQIIQIEYKLSKHTNHHKSMIVILTNITEKRTLEALMNKEQNILKMVVKALVNRTMFVEIASDFETFIEDGSVNQWLFNENEDENTNYIMRQLHTFKGNFSQFDVIELIEALHKSENQMMNAGVFDVEALKEAYQNDLSIIKTYCGDDFFLEDEYFLIEKARILEIEHKMQNVLSEHDCRLLLPEIRSLCYRPIKELFKMYPEYTLKMAERLDKTIYQFEIQSDGLSIDELKYQDFTKSMVHVFRNAIDHGIESPDERAELGKDIMGRIQCQIQSFEDHFEVTISDDGRGIDLVQIKKKLLTEGKSPHLVEAMSDEALYDVLFDNAFSTMDKATLLSGRGVGLSVVKREIEMLKGKIIVSSVLGSGTTFRFQLPLKAVFEAKEILPLNLMETLAVTCSNYLKTYVENETLVVQAKIEKANRLELNQLTALVSLKGVINALIMISVNRPLGRKLAMSFLVDPVDPDQIDLYVEDVLAEIANTVLGNTLGRLDDSSDFLHMGVPAIITNQGAYVKYTNAEMLTFSLQYGDFEWSVHMIQLENTEFEEESLWLE